MGGLGSAFLGYLADQTSIEYVYQISSIYFNWCVYVFLPNIKESSQLNLVYL
jgi:FSR family fosmidomycin resistance protein-like MFS transporter